MQYVYQFRRLTLETSRHALLLAACLALAATAQAEVVEEVISVPVTVRVIDKQEITKEMVVTIFHDTARQKSPYLILSHGRASAASQREKIGRERYKENSRYFVDKGFVVIVATRVGYGLTGGPDVEFSGNNCKAKNFAGGFAPAIVEINDMVKLARSLPYVDPNRGILVGQSVGGITTIGAAAGNIPGVLGAVNFSGGSGGDPDGRPDNPCSPDRIKELYGTWGASIRIPTLWLYSENDHFWGPLLPHEWFDAFVAAGGKARFVQLPPYKQNGHGIFIGDPDSWKSAFENFLREIGLAGS